jgi:hypothetical protein
MIESHDYFTRAAKKMRDPGKRANRALLRKKIEDEFGIRNDL